MLYSTLFIAAAAFTGVVSAQNNGTQDSRIEQEFDITPVNEANRTQICLAQRNTCRELCGQTRTNDCDETDLSYACVCFDYEQYNLTDYEQTVPGQICRLWQGQCVAANPDDLDSQTECLDVECGEQITDEGQNTTTSAASPTATSNGGSQTSNGGASPTSDDEAAETSSSEDSAAMLTFGMNYGTSVLAGGALLLFGLAL